MDFFSARFLDGVDKEIFPMFCFCLPGRVGSDVVPLLSVVSGDVSLSGLELLIAFMAVSFRSAGQEEKGIYVCI